MTHAVSRFDHVRWFPVTVLTIGLLTVALMHWGALEFDPKLDVAALIGVPAILYGILELRRNLRASQAAFVRDHVALFFQNKEMFSAYFDLVYNYDDAIFERVDREFRSVAPSTMVRPDFSFIPKELHRKKGRRFYHPRAFQGSQEEQRLDAFLSFFDVLGYYYHSRLIDIEEIAGTVGYYLLFLKDRKVFMEYMRVCRQAWEEPKYREISQRQPFFYLTNLLDDLEKYDKEHKEMVRHARLPRK